jgi:hypothetical protein
MMLQISDSHFFRSGADAAQNVTFSAFALAFDTQDGSGLRFLTMHRTEDWPRK